MFSGDPWVLGRERERYGLDLSLLSSFLLLLLLCTFEPRGFLYARVAVGLVDGWRRFGSGWKLAWSTDLSGGRQFGRVLLNEGTHPVRR